MPVQQKIAKKLPKRVGNDKLKTRRQASWVRTQVRKRQRNEDAQARRKANIKLREQGLPTPHEAKKISRCAVCHGTAPTHSELHKRVV